MKFTPSAETFPKPWIPPSPAASWTASGASWAPPPSAGAGEGGVRRAAVGSRGNGGSNTSELADFLEIF